MCVKHKVKLCEFFKFPRMDARRKAMLISFCTRSSCIAVVSVVRRDENRVAQIVTIRKVEQKEVFLYGFIILHILFITNSLAHTMNHVSKYETSGCRWRFHIFFRLS